MYSTVLRPLLFTLDPEKAHHAGLAGLKVLGLSGRRPSADPLLQVTLGREGRAVAFPNPIGLAAGFDKNAEAVRGVAALGFGFLEVGTLTPRPQPGNARPRLFRVPAVEALVNSLGFNNVGLAAARRNLDAARPAGIPVGVNIGRNKNTPNERAAEDYVAGVDAFHDAADFFVVNVSSPNTPGLRALQAPSEMGPLLDAVARRAGELSARAGRPRPLLFVKISPDEIFGESVAERAAAAGFDGVVATNTTRSRDGLPPGVPEVGGLSGRPLFRRSTEWVRRVRKAGGGRLAVIGVGGVFSARDAYEKILAGASLVEVYTGFVYEGPGFAMRLRAGLAELLRKDGFKTLADAVGAGG